MDETKHRCLLQTDACVDPSSTVRVGAVQLHKGQLYEYRTTRRRQSGEPSFVPRMPCLHRLTIQICQGSCIHRWNPTQLIGPLPFYFRRAANTIGISFHKSYANERSTCCCGSTSFLLFFSFGPVRVSSFKRTDAINYVLLARFSFLPISIPVRHHWQQTQY